MNPLATLRDIHLPDTPGWWPPAPGWWAMAALAALAAVLIYAPLRAWAARRRLRRRLYAELDRLGERAATGTPPREVLGELSTLLRRVALARHPRARVAGLAGEAWLGFLDETGGGGAFCSGAGRALALAPYARSADGEVDLAALLAAARAWLARNA